MLTVLILLFQTVHKFSVFTFMPSKIEIETIQYRKSRIWEMKGDKEVKGLAKDHVGAIFHMRDTLKNVLTQLIKLCMERPSKCRITQKLGNSSILY